MKPNTTPLAAVTALAAIGLLGASPALAAPNDEAVSPEPAQPEPTPEPPAPVTTAPPVVTTTTEAPVTTTTTTAPGKTTTTTTAPGKTTTTTTAPGKTTTTVTDGSTTTSSPDTTVPETTIPPGAQLGVQVPIDGDYGAILLTIRTLESGNNYTIPKNRGGASGAYQFIDRTWNNFGGYPSAYLAPPWVQDQKALADVQRFLAQWGGDVSMIPVMWYYPIAATNPVLMDQVPMPGAGNSLTIREYQYKWMKLYQRFSGKDIDLASYEPGSINDRLGLPPIVVGGLGELAEVAYPVLGETTIGADAACEGEDCEPGQDAIVFGQQLQPILTAFEGVVTAVEPGDAVTGEVSVTVTDLLGRTYTYQGFNNPELTTPEGGEPNQALSLSANAKVGATVRAGTILGFMGAPPAAEGETEAPRPYLRLTIRDQAGQRIDAAALVATAQEREACRIDIGPWSTPANPSIGIDANYPVFDPVVTETEQGSWTIHADGTVTAVGSAALVFPEAGCEWKPEEPYGPAAAGAAMPDELLAPLELPAALFVKGAPDGIGGGQLPIAAR